MFNKNLLLAAVGVLLIGSSSAALAQTKWLTVAEVKQEIIGKSFSFVGKSKGTVTFNAGGTVTASTNKFGNLKGKWWFRGTRWCRIYSKWPKKTRCLRFKRIAGGKYHSSDGSKMTPR